MNNLSSKKYKKRKFDVYEVLDSRVYEILLPEFYVRINDKRIMYIGPDSELNNVEYMVREGYVKKLFNARECLESEDYDKEWREYTDGKQQFIY